VGHCVHCDHDLSRNGHECENHVTNVALPLLPVADESLRERKVLAPQIPQVPGALGAFLLVGVRKVEGGCDVKVQIYASYC
jgi:hypothetical protein